MESEGYKNKLKSRLFGLLCEYEKGREWESYLDAILIEIGGFKEEDRSINYYILYYNLASGRYLSHKYFRKVIFDSMTLLEHI